MGLLFVSLSGLPGYDIISQRYLSGKICKTFYAVVRQLRILLVDILAVYETCFYAFYSGKAGVQDDFF